VRGGRGGGGGRGWGGGFGIRRGGGLGIRFIKPVLITHGVEFNRQHIAMTSPYVTRKVATSPIVGLTGLHKNFNLIYNVTIIAQNL
jgi:hypothetical protein